jgi:hypothetical protein
MDLEQMKEQFKRVAAPADGAGRGPVPRDRSLDGLIETMKALDARDLALLRRSLVFFAVAGVFYLGLFVLTFIAPPDDQPGFHRAILGLIGLALTGIGLRIRMMVRELSAVDYGEPVLEFLAKVEKRIRFVRKEDLVVAIPLSLILAVAATLGFMSAAERYFPSLDRMVPLEIMVVILAWATAVGWGLRRKQWRKRLPVLEEARRLRDVLKRGDEGAEREE